MAGALNRNITVRIMADASKYTATMAKVQGDTQKTATTMEAAGGHTRLLTTGLAAAGVAAAALGVAAVNMAADFDQSMSTVQANTGASAQEMQELRQAAIDAGASTVYSASESADAINELGKAGMSTADILSGGLSGALDLAASDGMDVAEAAELMSSAMAQFNLTGSDATSIADALAAGAGKAQGSAHDLGYALQQSGMVANSFGISMEETVGTLTSFANAGMIGSDAGTSLKTMLVSLANPSSKAAGLMEELGISAYDAQGNFVGLAELAGQLQTRMGGLSQEQRNQALATIFGSDAIRAANVLYGEGAEGIANWTREVSESGYAAAQAAAKNDNLRGDLENLSGSFESLMISLGEGAQGPLRQVVQGVDTLVDAFSGLPAPLQQGIVLATAAVGGMTALHSALKPLNTSSSGLAKNLGLAIDPMQRLTTAAPLLKEGFGALGATFTTSIKALGSGTPAIDASTAAMSGLKSIGSGIVTLMGGPWGIAMEAAAAALVVWVQEAQRAKQAAEEIQTAFESSGDATETLVDQIMSDTFSANGIIDWFDQIKLQAEDVPDLLDKAGISISDFASAAMGDADALERVNATIDDMWGHSTTDNERAKALVDILDRTTQAYDAGSEAAKRKKAALDDLGVSEDDATDAMGDYSDAASQAADDTQDLTDQIDGLLDAFLSLEAAHLSADEAVTRLDQSILDLDQDVARTGKVLDENGDALAGLEDKAYDAQGGLQSLASTAQDTARKILEEGQATGDMETATRNAGDALDRAREAFIRNATASGVSREAAEALADRYGLARGKADELARSIDAIPEQKTVNVNANTELAYAKITSIGDALARLQNKEITAAQTTRYFIDNVLKTGGSKPGAYTGGLYDGTGFARRGYASGGLVTGLVAGTPPIDPTVDNVLLGNARLRSGEFVASQPAVDYYGVDLFDALNRRRIPRSILMTAPPPVMSQPAGSVPSVTNVTQHFEQKIVRADQDLHVAASILYRNATREARLIGR